jgi:iron complex outermembrane receptor protein
VNDPPTAPRPRRTTVVDSPASRLQTQADADVRNAGTVTALNLDTVDGAIPADGAAELLARFPGATVRSIGGLGQFSAVSIRGSSAEQVQVVIDGVPLNDSFAGLTDLSLLPLETAGRIEVYRGFIPLRFGGAAPGGVVQLVGRPIDATRTSARGGLGSFGARQLSLTHDHRFSRRWGASAHVGYAGAAGDFPFYSTANTPSIPEDDSLVRRTNNSYDRVVGHLRIEGRGDRWRWTLRQFVSDRRRGIAGPATAQSERASLRTTQARTISQVKHLGLGGPGGAARGVLGLTLQRSLLEDPRGELGVGTGGQGNLGVDAYGSPQLRLPAWRGSFIDVHGAVRLQRVSIETIDGDEIVERVGHGRLSARAGLGVEQHLHEDRWRIDAGATATVVRSDIAESAANPLAGQARKSTDVGWAPRLAIRWRGHRNLDVRGSVGGYFRPPTLLELFGDRGFAVGNSDLEPERGFATDLGITWTSTFGGHERSFVRARVGGFLNLGQDTITWVQAAQVARPINIGGSLAAGAESALFVSIHDDALTLDANYTFLETENRGGIDGQSGNPLPGRPRHEATARATTGWEFRRTHTPLEPRLTYTLDALAATYLDPSGRFSLPPRILHGVSMQLDIDRRMRVAFEVRNLANTISTTWTPPTATATPQAVPITDFIGYPIPGRSLWLTIGFHAP